MDKADKKAVGILINHFNDYIYMPANGAISRAKELGYDTRVFCLPPIIVDRQIRNRDMENYQIKEDSVLEVLSVIENYNIGALLVLTDVADFVEPTIFRDFQKKNPLIPMASIATQIESATLVMSDNYASSFNAAEYLVEAHGCKQIAYIKGPSGNNEADERFRAYCDCLEKHSIPYDHNLVFQGDWFFTSGEEAVKVFIDQRSLMPEAIMAANDNMAYGAIDGLTRKNISVPEDIKIMGYDNSSYSEMYGFSSVTQPMGEMGGIAVEELVNRMKNPERLVKTIRVPGPLIIRRGCGCDQSFRDKISMIPDRWDDAPKAWKKIVKSLDKLSFDSSSQKNQFTEDFKTLWHGLLEIIFSGENEHRDQVIHQLKIRFFKILKSHRENNINAAFWLSLLIRIQEDCQERNLRYLDRFFSSVINEVDEAVAVEVSQIHRAKEETEYSMMVAGQRLIVAHDLATSAQIALELVSLIDSEFACILLEPEDENLKRKGKFLIAARMVKDKIYTYEEEAIYVSKEQLIDINPKKEVMFGDSSTHFSVIPLGDSENIRGYLIASITQNRIRWTVFRLIQAQLTQALYNLDLFKISSEAAAEKAANVVKSDFLTRMTHELKTPLNGIMGMSQLLEKTDLSTEQQGYLSAIKSSGSLLMGLITDILDVSKMENEKIELNFVDFYLSECIESAFELVRNKAAKKGLTLSYYIEPDVPNGIRQDKNHLRQIICCLLSNAVKFTHQGDVYVHVTFHSDEQKILFEVKDTGIGLTKKQKGVLFKSFSQGAKSIHQEFGGAGLGLVIAGRLCSAMEGELNVDHDYDDGANFTLKLPFQPVKKDLASFRWEESTQWNTDRLKKVYYVSRHSIYANIIGKWVKRWGWQFEALAVQDWIAKVSTKKEEKDACVLIDIDDLGDDISSMSQWLEKYPSTKFSGFVFDFNICEKLPTHGNFSIFQKPIYPQVLHDVLITFTKILTASNKAKEVQAAINKYEDFSKQFPLTILLAEDNVINQKVAMAMLKKCGYTADVVNNGAEAVEAQKKVNYDVILMDIIMPEMDGETATKVIRQECPTEEQPYIIAVTANTQVGDREKLLASGLDDYVSKPVKMDLLMSTLKKAPSIQTNQ